MTDPLAHVEAAARLVYDAMRFGRESETPPWVYGGNSDVQDRAREVAGQLVDGPIGSFSWALAHVKRGMKIRRAGWNGKGMWVALSPGIRFAHDAARDGSARHLAEEMRQLCPTNADYCDIVTAPRLDMRAADGSLVIGWLASQTDMLTDDWEIVPSLLDGSTATV